MERHTPVKFRVESTGKWGRHLMECSSCGPLGVSPDKATAKTYAAHHLSAHGVTKMETT